MFFLYHSSLFVFLWVVLLLSAVIVLILFVLKTDCFQVLMAVMYHFHFLPNRCWYFSCWGNCWTLPSSFIPFDLTVFIDANMLLITCTMGDWVRRSKGCYKRIISNELAAIVITTIGKRTSGSSWWFLGKHSMGKVRNYQTWMPSSLLIALL